MPARTDTGRRHPPGYTLCNSGALDPTASPQLHP